MATIRNLAAIPLQKHNRFGFPAFPVIPPQWLKTMPPIDYALPKYYGIVYLLIIIVIGTGVSLLSDSVIPFILGETLYLTYAFFAVRRAKIRIKELQDSWTSLDLVWKIDVSFSFFLNMSGTLTLMEYNYNAPETIKIKVHNSFERGRSTDIKSGLQF